MSTIVEATVPADQFALAEALSRVPTTEIRMVRLVAHGSEYVMPFVWAGCDDAARVRDALADDPTTESVTLLSEFDGEALFRVDWAAKVRVFVSIVAEEDATILDACGRDGTWHLQVFFPDHELVSATREFCEDFGIDLELERVNRLSEASEYGHLGLTERQYETLVDAYEAGYYEVPRTVNQEELAEHFDVSHQALSERLRRAHETVITNALYHKIHRRDHDVSPRIRHEAD
ncbi:helix-turn-helix domain-containing protein [Halosimplex halophilum]|uniref:helix-turn-helix domain-containing protein n=1 Tax=Halosimplex halophilum TaxID=2559572 RepID=UPI00107F3BFD|nr:helix-turn-helix domain-containing protein [Halosimplex halophilum]